MFIRRVRSAKKAARTNLKRKVTLKTIADHLGLTPGTVSAALNNSAAARSILEHTKQRIRIAARELNYRPNVSARILRLKKVGITHFRVVFSSFFSL